MVDEYIRKEKIKGFNNKCTSNHYAHRVSDYDQGRIDEINQIDEPELNTIGYLLAGYIKEELDTN